MMPQSEWVNERTLSSPHAPVNHAIIEHYRVVEEVGPYSIMNRMRDHFDLVDRRNDK